MPVRGIGRFRQMCGKPFGGQVRDLVEGAGFFEQMGGVGDDFELLLSRH